MSKNLIIDTNLLLLLIIGSIDNGLCIRKSKRLNDYSPKDFDFLVEIMKKYEKIFITPYIATEVSNLIDLNDRLREEAFQITKILFKSFEQIDVNINEDCHLKSYNKFGITDASIVKLVEDYCVLTNDQKLIPLLVNANYNNTLNFKYI